MNFESRISAMRVGYRSRAAERLARACEAVGHIQPGDPAARLTDIRIVLHDLAGTAATMGMEQLGVEARRLEDDVVAAGAELSVDELTAISEGLLALSRNLIDVPDPR